MATAKNYEVSVKAYLGGYPSMLTKSAYEQNEPRYSAKIFWEDPKAKGLESLIKTISEAIKDSGLDVVKDHSKLVYLVEDVLDIPKDISELRKTGAITVRETSKSNTYLTNKFMVNLDSVKYPFKIYDLEKNELFEELTPGSAIGVTLTVRVAELAIGGFRVQIFPKEIVRLDDTPAKTEVPVSSGAIDVENISADNYI